MLKVMLIVVSIATACGFYAGYEMYNKQADALASQMEKMIAMQKKIDELEARKQAKEMVEKRQYKHFTSDLSRLKPNYGLNKRTISQFKL